MATKRPSSVLVDSIGLERLLLDNYVTFTDKLQAKKVIPRLIQEKILSINDKQEIIAHTTSQEKAQALLDKLINRGTCTSTLFVDVLRQSGQGHLADMLERKPNSKVVRTEGYKDMSDAQLRELDSRLNKVYREEVARQKGDTSLEGLKGFEMSDAKIRFWVRSNRYFLITNELSRRALKFMVDQVAMAGRQVQVGTAFAADWVGPKKFTSDYKQMFKLKLNKVRKNQRIIDIIFDQLLHDSKYEPSFSKESLWRHMEQTQEEILFVLEGLDRLNPFTSPEILQLIDKKLLPRASVIVTVAKAKSG